MRAPGLGYPFLALDADAIEFEKPVGILLDDIKHCFTKRSNQFSGEVGANPFDHSGAEIFFDTFQRARRDDS